LIDIDFPFYFTDTGLFAAAQFRLASLNDWLVRCVLGELTLVIDGLPTRLREWADSCQCAFFARFRRFRGMIMNVVAPGLASIRKTLRRSWAGRSLQFAVLLSVVFAFLLPGAGFMMAQRWGAERRAQEALENDLTRYVEVLSAALRTPLWELSRDNAESIVRAIVSDERFVSVTVMDVASGGPFVSVTRAGKSTSTALRRDKEVHYKGERVGSFVLIMSLSPYLDVERRQSQGQLVQLLVVLASSMALIVFVFRRRLIQPLDKLTTATQRISDGDLATPIGLGYHDELGKVAVAMDGMRKRLLGAFEELHRKNEILESLNELASDWIWEQDDQFRFNYFSSSMERIVGLNPDMLLGKTRWECPSDLGEDEWLAHRACIQAHRPFRDFEYGAPRQDGSMIYLSVSGHPVFSSNEVFCGYRGTGRNITDRKRWEQELVTSEQAIRDLNTDLEAKILERTAELAKAKFVAEQASLAKSTFLANMSHEIRTPMNAIIGLTHVLRREIGAKQPLERLDKIGSAAQHLLGIINDILDLSKIEAGKLVLDNRDFDIDRMLQSVADMVRSQAAAKDLELIVDTDHLPPTVHGDGNRLGQILLNFVGNAIKFTEQGRVLLRCRVVGSDSASLMIRFEVDDTGIGLAPEQQGRLFEAFEQADVSTTRKFGGTGLGLAICKRLATLMAGTVGCTSELGRGSNFWVEVPLLRRDDVVWPQLPQEFDRGTRVLVVDDLEEAREPLLEILGSLGLRADAVASGEAALDAIVQADQAGSAFDIAFVDWKMPGLDGFATARRISELPLQHRPRLVMVSAASSVLTLDEFSAAGFSGFLAKPVTPSALFEALLGSLHPVTVSPALWGGASAAEAELSHYGHAAILMVEDNPTNRIVAMDLLGAVGLRADTAADGVDAVEMAKRRRYDLILMDMQMPRMDGLEATRQIRRLPGYASVAIVAMTANAFSADRDRCLEAGMNDHVAKPVDPERLFQTLLRHFRLSALCPGSDSSRPPPPAEASFVTSVVRSCATVETVMDWQGLEQRYAGRTEFIGKLLRATIDFFRDTPRQLAQLISNNDFDGIGRIAHGLKSTGANLMALPLREVAQRTELLVRRLDPDGLEQAGELRTILSRVLAEGESWLEKEQMEKRDS
jgi:PAS domain S-box-containing protein